MPLTRGAWKLIMRDAPHNDRILIVPEWEVIFTVAQLHPGQDDRWHNWACRFREEADGVVYTSLTKSTVWQRESYRMEDGNLVWTTPTGTSVWSPIEESAIPAILEARIPVLLERLNSASLPEYPVRDS